jgi:prepilin-type N-terminal cleavage/methylation domain-containing protein
MKNAKLKMGNEKSDTYDFKLCSLQFAFFNSRRDGFTLLEVLIAIAIVGSLLVTLIYTLNYHLGLAERQKTITIATLLRRIR